MRRWYSVTIAAIWSRETRSLAQWHEDLRLTCDPQARAIARAYPVVAGAGRFPGGYEGAIIVENGERGDTERVVERAPALVKARFRFENRGNKSLALNAALANIPSGLIIFLDDDVRLEEDVLWLHAEAAERHGPGHFSVDRSTRTTRKRRPSG